MAKRPDKLAKVTRVTSVTSAMGLSSDAPSAEDQASKNGKGKLDRPQQTRSIGSFFGLGSTFGGKVGGVNSLWPWLPPGPMGQYNCDGNNPWSWTGPGQPWSGTWNTYDWILRHPKIAHVRQDILNPIQESSWEAFAEDGVPQTITDAVQKAFAPLRRQFVDDAMRSLSYGTVAFEIVWRKGLKLTEPDRLVPQPVAGTQLLRDEAGNFAGIRPPSWALTPSGSIGPQPYLGVLYSMIVKYNASFGSLYGESILENVRETSWRGWLQAFAQAGKLGEKVSGILGMLLYPAGKFSDDVGNEISFEDSANKAIQGLMRNQFVSMQNLALSGATPSEVAALAAKSMVQLQVVDFGNQAQAIEGFVKLMMHHENGMSEGLLTSPTVNSEAQHNSRGTSESHGAAQVRFSEKLNMDFAESMNDRYGPVSNFVAFNYGEEYRGRVKLRAVPINDERVQAYRTFVASAMNVPQVAGIFVKMVDRQQLLKTIGLPVKNDASEEDLKQLVVAAKSNPDSSSQSNRPVGKSAEASIDKAPSDKAVT